MKRMDKSSLLFGVSVLLWLLCLIFYLENQNMATNTSAVAATIITRLTIAVSS